MSLPRNVVLLCQCHGEISRSLPLEEIRYFLEQRKPGWKEVIGDGFCQYQVISKLLKEEAFQLLYISHL